jgi:hypothetical protein
VVGSRGFYASRKRSFLESLIALIMHLVGTGVVFVALFAVTWAASWILSWLLSVHPLPEDVMGPIHLFEKGLIYLDFAVCTIMLVSGGWRFCKEVFEE